MLVGWIFQNAFAQFAEGWDLFYTIDCGWLNRLSMKRGSLLGFW